MAVFIRTSDVTVTTDNAEVNLLVGGDDLIVGREATLVGTGVNTVVVRAAAGNSMVLNGELLAQEEVILATGGAHDITIGVDGVLASATDEAIEFEGGDNNIFNSGQIAGQTDGIDIFGDSNRITNTGEISGQEGEAITIDGASNRITNHGSISGVFDDGIFITGNGNNLIVNTGTISGVNDDGIDMDGLTDSTNRLINSGTISTDTSASYDGSSANDIILNNGLMIGTVSLQGGNDRLNTRFGTVDGDVLAGSGNDTLLGSENGDSFFGGADDDVLRGNGGDDLLNGNEGKDTLVGGAGEDTFQFNSAVVAANADQVLDFVVGEDVFQLENAFFTGVAEGTLTVAAFRAGAAAADGNDRIVYNSTTGALLFDADGNGAGAAVKIANLDKNLALSNTDFFVI